MYTWTFIHVSKRKGRNGKVSVGRCVRWWLPVSFPLFDCDVFTWEEACNSNYHKEKTDSEFEEQESSAAYGA